LEGGEKNMLLLQKIKNQKGFTLVELLVVISIIGILVAIAIPRFTSATATANTAKMQADLRTIDSAIQMFAANNGGAVPAADADVTAVAGLAPYLPTTLTVPRGRIMIAGVEVAQPTSYGINANGRAIATDGGANGLTAEEINAPAVAAP
jgi:general secretion pathway protein G